MLFLLLPANGYLHGQMMMRSNNQPTVIGWADDNNYLLRHKTEAGDWVVSKINAKNGKSVDLKDYKSEREILNSMLPRGYGVGMSDVVSPSANSVIFSKENDLWYFNMSDKAMKKITDSPKDEEVNVRYSPDGGKIAFTRNRDLYIIELATGKETRITSDASGKVYNGWASWVYFEEILGRASRYSAFWWSPDSKKIAWLRFDDTPVPDFTLVRLDEEDGVNGTTEVTPYPKPGDKNPLVRMGIADVTTASTVWVKTDVSVDQYLAWPSWTPDSKNLMIQVLNRDQNDMRFILADIATGDFREIYRESRPTWVDFFEDIYVLNDGSGFIIRSYRNDWDNLYYQGWDGNLKSQITNVGWRVTSIDRVDEKKGIVYFYGTGPESTDNQYFSATLDGKKITQLTSAPGTHNVSLSPTGAYVIDSWSSISVPAAIELSAAGGKMMKEIFRENMPEYDPAKHSKSELVRIATSDGQFMMPAVITYPLNFNPATKYPVVFTIYGGPDAGTVRNRWGGSSPSWYAQNNIVTIAVDHRASGHFGKKGLDFMHRNLGVWEILDYADAVKWLREKSWVDGSRMGITGSSYGGYMTCLALTKGAEYWTHGNAGSSVTDWKLYDNVYTERFMDTPADNPDGYKAGSVLSFASDLKGELRFYHGDMDDNVHMQNSIQLISKLQDAGKSFEFMLYPNGRHGWGGAKRVHSTNESNKFWLRVFFGK